MKSLSGLTIRYMTKNRKRTFTTLVGVFFAALLIFLMFEVTDSVTKSIKENNVRKTGGRDLVLETDGETALKLKQDATSLHLGGVEITNLWILEQRPSVDAYDSFEAMKDPATLSRGNYPENSKEIIVDTKQISGAEIGRDVELYEGTFRVTGFYSGDENSMTEGITKISDEEIRQAEQVSVCVTLKDKSNLEGQLETIIGAYSGVGGEVSEAALILYGQSSEFRELGRDVMLLLLALVFAAFLMVIIRNAFNISVDERMKDYGILRCIGLTKGQIFKMILLEAFLVALIGCAAGILVGYGITAGGLRAASLLQVVEDSFGRGFAMHEVISLKAILITMGLVFLTTSLSMVSPIQKLFKMAPIAAQRKAESVSRPKKNQSLLNKGGKNIAIAYGIRSAKRSRGRFARTVITYALGLSLVVGFANILKTMMATEYPALYSYDYAGMTSSEEKWAGLIDTLKSSDNCKGVAGVLSYVEYEKDEKNYSKPVISVTGVTRDLWERILAGTALSPDGSKDVVEVILLTSVELKSEYKAGDTFRVKYSDKTFHIAGTAGAKWVDMLLEANGYGLMAATRGQFVYLAERGVTVFGDVMEKSGTATGFGGVSVLASASAEASGSKKDLQDLMAASLDATRSVGGAFAILGAIRTAALAVLIFLLLIAVVNAINVCRGQLNVRKDEIRTLRLIGMSERQRQRMLLAENMFASVLAAIIGPIIGTLAAFGVTKMLYNGNGLTGKFDPFEMSVHFSVDWGVVIVAMIAVLVSGFLVTFFNRKD